MFDATKTAINIALNVASNNLALHQARFCEGKTFNHLIAQGVGILRIESVVRCYEHEIEHTVLVFLQLVIRYDDGRMRFERAIRKEETNLNMSL